MQSQGGRINFNTVCHAARVSKTFLYDPKHADLAEQIRSLRQLHPLGSRAQCEGSKQERLGEGHTDCPLQGTH